MDKVIEEIANKTFEMDHRILENANGFQYKVLLQIGDNMILEEISDGEIILINCWDELNKTWDRGIFFPKGKIGLAEALKYLILK